MTFGLNAVQFLGIVLCGSSLMFVQVLLRFPFFFHVDLSSFVGQVFGFRLFVHVYACMH